MCFYMLLFLICTICYFRELLQTKKRQEETFERLNAVLGESCISCEIQPVGPEYEISQQVSPLPPSAEELFSSELSDNQNNTQALTPDSSRLKRTNINLDNSLSPGHSLLQIQCVDRSSVQATFSFIIQGLRFSFKSLLHCQFQTECKAIYSLLNNLILLFCFLICTSASHVTLRPHVCLFFFLKKKG